MWSHDNISYCTKSLYFVFWWLTAYPLSFWLAFVSTECIYVCMDMSLHGPRCVWKLWWRGKCITRRKQWLFSKDRAVCFPLGSHQIICALTNKSYCFALPISSNFETHNRDVFMYSFTVCLYITFYTLLTLKEDDSASFCSAFLFHSSHLPGQGSICCSLSIVLFGYVTHVHNWLTPDPYHFIISQGTVLPSTVSSRHEVLHHVGIYLQHCAVSKPRTAHCAEKSLPVLGIGNSHSSNMHWWLHFS
jgi:hypothetical protein